MATDLYTIFYSEINIFLLCEDDTMSAMLRGMWDSPHVKWTTFSSPEQMLEQLFLNPPHMLVLSRHFHGTDCQAVINAIKKENVYGHVRVVVLLPQEEIERGVDWGEMQANDFITLPCTAAAARARLELVLHRSTHSLDANPLTKLPGNVSIAQTITRYGHERIAFSLAYVDVDNFKPFNDRYGFARGDEVLLMTARILSATVRNLDVHPNFVGHIGGDDFVFILPTEVMAEACEKVIASYDAIVPNFYDETERAQGYIESHDRRGVAQRFPFLSLSIAAVSSPADHPRQFSELSHIAGQLKHAVKSRLGSNYILDRRNN